MGAKPGHSDARADGAPLPHQYRGHTVGILDLHAPSAPDESK